MAKTIIMGSRIWQSGTYDVVSTLLPTGFEYIRFGFDVTDMLVSVLSIAVTLEISYDGGITWGEKNGVRFQGGPIRMTDMEGNPITRTPPYISLHSTHISQPSNPNRRLRGAVVVAGGSLRTEVTLETY